MACSIIFERENICTRLSARMLVCIWKIFWKLLTALKDEKPCIITAVGKFYDFFFSIIPPVKSLSIVFVNELMNLWQFSRVFLHVIWSKY